MQVPENPWEDISTHFALGMQECEGFDIIQIVLDTLSTIHYFIPCHTNIDSLELAEMFLCEVVCLYGLPLTIVSDQGLQFAFASWGQICDWLEIDQRISTAFHSKTDEHTE
jgi:hypothetical protein